MHRILVVDDQVVITMQLEERLTGMGYEVVGRASSGEASIDMARHFRPDLVLMDIVMPGRLDGIDASKVIQTELEIPIIFLTAYADDEYVQRAKHVEPYGYIVKPFQEKEIKAAIEVALYKKQIELVMVIQQARLRERVERHAVELEKRMTERIAELRRLLNEISDHETRMAELEDAIRQLRDQLQAASLTSLADDALTAGRETQQQG